MSDHWEQEGKRLDKLRERNDKMRNIRVELEEYFNINRSSTLAKQIALLLTGKFIEE